MEAINILIAGIGAFVVILFFAALAPLFNVVVSLVLSNTADTTARLLIQLAFPLLVFMLLLSVLEYKSLANQNLM